MNHPRLVLAGSSGDSGKTLVSLGLLLAAREAGIETAAFKKGPDYIDAAWLSWAGGRPARNLDTYLMGFEGAAASFARHATPARLNLIEGNRGLYDGVDAAGTHSTAELAKLLGAPVVLVLNVTKQTRTAAAVVLGAMRLDPELKLAGVILNQVSGARHERILRDSIESVCGIPVLGAVPRAAAGTPLPERHLGLVPPEEHTRTEELRANLRSLVRVDFKKLLRLARQVQPVEPPTRPATAAVGDLTIGYLRDSAFTFYYPDNLEALEAAGARLEAVSALSAGALPASLDALYIGGGFPETHAQALAANRPFLESLREAARAGLPVYAECGGLMLLARALRWQDVRYPMAGVLPFEVEVCARPQGHGYACLEVDHPNPFFPVGQTIRGHEFHYSRILISEEGPPTACAVRRGTGCYAGREGVLVGNVWAGYVHVHAVGLESWAAGVVAAAQRFSVVKHSPAL